MYDQGVRGATKIADPLYPIVEEFGENTLNAILRFLSGEVLR